MHNESWKSWAVFCLAVGFVGAAILGSDAKLLETGIHWLETWAILATAALIWWTADETRMARGVSEQQLAHAKAEFGYRDRAGVRPVLVLVFGEKLIEIDNIGHGPAVDVIVRSEAREFENGVQYGWASRHLDYVRHTSSPAKLEFSLVTEDGDPVPVNRAEAEQIGLLLERDWADRTFFAIYRDLHGTLMWSHFRLDPQTQRFVLEGSGYGSWLAPISDGKPS